MLSQRLSRKRTIPPLPPPLRVCLVILYLTIYCFSSIQIYIYSSQKFHVTLCQILAARPPPKPNPVITGKQVHTYAFSASCSFPTFASVGGCPNKRCQEMAAPGIQIRVIPHLSDGPSLGSSSDFLHVKVITTCLCQWNSGRNQRHSYRPESDIDGTRVQTNETLGRASVHPKKKKLGRPRIS